MRYLTILLTIGAALGQTLPNAVPVPQPEIQYFGADGLPLALGKLCTYAAGTSTPLVTYTDSTAGTPNTNPIILDVAGRASVWIGPQLYKFVLRTGGDSTCFTGSVVWTQDNVADTTLYFVNYIRNAGTSTLISYTAPFTGAIARTVAAKLAENMSIFDFGAVCDGATDDQAAFDLATAYLASSTGGSLWIPTGVCIHSDVISLPSNTMLRGYGNSSVLQGTTPAASAVRTSGTSITSVSGITIRDLLIVGPGGVRLTNADSSGIYVAFCGYCSVQGVTVTGSSSAAMLIEGGHDIQIASNAVHDTNADGVNISNAAARITVTGNTFNNTGDDCISSVSYGGGSPQTQVSDVTATGNACTNSAAGGMTNSGSVRTNYTGNVIQNTVAHGIRCVEDNFSFPNAPSECLIADNIVVNADSGHTGSFLGILAIGVSGAKISNNIIRDSPGIAVQYFFPSDRVQINGNRLYNVPIWGIIADGNASHVNVSNNEIETAAFGCIAFSATTAAVSDVFLNSNKCNDIQAHGVQAAIDMVGASGLIGQGNVATNVTGGAGPWRVSGGTGVYYTPVDANFQYDGITLKLGATVTTDPTMKFQTRGGHWVIEDDKNLYGSGLSADLNLFSGQFTGDAAASVILNMNRDNTVPLAQILFKNNGVSFLKFVTPTAPTANKALCIKGDGLTVGRCSSTVSGSGGCTCI